MENYYESHIFVCENQREPGKRISCGNQNSLEIRNYLKSEVKGRGLSKKIRINSSGCLDRCEEGPVLVAYPKGDWFCIHNLEEAERFLENYVYSENKESISNLELKKTRE
ncbi:MAG: (2Fe-2S) ferredoxin domain-containing protein [Leptospiraceae bacterium]|nr:(2Fe-2S) ferredoxin domain-containing protein [Leptospiraceae bacterium]MCP5512343.1 (2Fe-2S) ferredoxin domain-containing protein [Leptospiraceae bacterium]